MNLSAPKNVTWIIAVVVGVLGLLGEYGVFSVGVVSDFMMVAIGFVLLAIGTFFKGV